MAGSQQKRSNALSIAEETSSKPLAMMLEEAAQVYQSEILPGQMRVWLECFRRERPEMLKAAFGEYFRTGKFFPKPADIREIIEARRVAYRARDYQPIDHAKTEQDQATPEWQEISEKARKLLAQLAGRQFDPKANGRELLKMQAAELQKRRRTE
jgi:hypothetical protein